MKLPSSKILALSLASGVLAGLAATVFLYLLDIATRARQVHPFFILGLPLAGLAIGLAYHHLGGRSREGAALILDEIHDPQDTLPASMAPLVLLGTLLTHLAGGSAGREGTAVQMGASLSDQLARRGKLNSSERRSLLMGGMGAGFGAAIGAPIAGVVFGLEVIETGKVSFFAFFECVLASAAGFLVTYFLHAPHSVYPAVGPIPLELPLPFLVVGFGLLFGFVARAFVLADHSVASLFKRIFAYPPLRPFMGGILLLALFYWEGSGRYCGLGIEVIQGALRLPASWMDPVLKFGFTSLTLGSGFKGGEFIPLVFMGTTLGSVLAAAMGLSVSLFGALGFAAVFGAAASTPLACAVMAAELFGWNILPYALLCCYAGSFVSGFPGIYGKQRFGGGKILQPKQLRR